MYPGLLRYHHFPPKKSNHIATCARRSWSTFSFTTCLGQTPPAVEARIKSVRRQPKVLTKPGSGPTTGAFPSDFYIVFWAYKQHLWTCWRVQAQTTSNIWCRVAGPWDPPPPRRGKGHYPPAPPCGTVVLLKCRGNQVDSRTCSK